MRLRSLGLVALFCVTFVPIANAGATDEPLFKYDGKTYQAKDLPAAEQQQVFETLSEAHMRLEALADQAALKLYVDAEAKKEGKLPAEIEVKLFAVAEPTEQQVKDFFEENKSRIPPGYTIEKVSGQIKDALREQAKKEKRDQLVASLKKSGKLAFLPAEPVAPKVTLAVSGFPAKGPDTAPVTVVEFADYQCPHCKAASPVVDGMLKKFDGKVRLVFIDYPIKGEFSELAAQGAFCAERQGKYWQFHDLAYDKQATLHMPDAPATLAAELGLDAAQFKTCMASPEAKQRVASGKAEGDRIGLTGTPSIYVNGQRIRGYDEAELEKEIQKALKHGAS